MPTCKARKEKIDEMKKLEYLQTIEGRINARFERSLNIRRICVKQEPKSKNGISNTEKVSFRKEVKEYLKKSKKRAHRGDIILKLDFWVTTQNPPAIHTLAKNYLDLLHKELPQLDSLKEILFKDDSQVKILISNYYLDTEKSDGAISIESQNLGGFIKDLEIVDQIDTEEEDLYADDFERSIEGLSTLEEIKDLLPKDYDKLKKYWTWQVQKSFLELHEVRISSLISVFRNRFAKNKFDFDFDFDLQEIFESQERAIIFTTNFLELGKAPSQPGDTKIFKKNVLDKLREFRKKYKLLFPLLNPIRVNVLFIPPKSNVADLDNIGRYIVPFVNEVLKPPISSKGFYDELQSSDRKKPPTTILGYQIIHIPRKDDDDENGCILFIISEGLFNYDLWWKIDEIIEDWSENRR